MGYSTGCHTTFHHRYHIVWAPKCRFKVLHGEVRLRVREIIRRVCDEMGVTIINGALSAKHRLGPCKGRDHDLDRNFDAGGEDAGAIGSGGERFPGQI